MCINPSIAPNGKTFACRRCQQCKDNKVADWSGRCIAELYTSIDAWFVTLTYGRDNRYESEHHEASVKLTYKDVQLWLKRFRTRGRKIRYFAVGEYGSKKGRSHWHVLLFWRSKPPVVQFNENIDLEGWDHGYGYVEPCTVENIRYTLKYITKDAFTDRHIKQGLRGMSRFPPIGDQFFRERALTFVEQGLSPQDYKYGFADVRAKKGHIMYFYMHRKSGDNFMRYFTDAWRAKHGNDDWPESLAVTEWLDAKARAEREKEEFQMSEAKRFKKAEFPWAAPPGNCEVQWSDSSNSWYSYQSVGNEMVTWYWTFNKEGKREWSKTILSEDESERHANAGRSSQRNQEQYRSQSNGDDMRMRGRA